MNNRNQAPLLEAGGDIGVSVFVKLSTSAGHTALAAGANEQVIGISQVGPKEPPGLSGASALAAAAGDQLQIFGLGDICLLKAGSGGWTAGDNLKAGTAGVGVVAASTGTTVQNIGAVALTDAAGDEYGLVQIIIMKTRPALA
jgi:hypothetical protein